MRRFEAMGFHCRAVAAALLLSCMLSAPVHAATTRTFSVDLPEPTDRALPPWLGRPSVSTNDGITTATIPLAAALSGKPLAITAWFDESQVGSIRASWVSQGSEAVLCENLIEGTGLPNHRTLWLDAAQLARPGVLIFTSPSSTPPVSRIRFEWLESAQVLAAQNAPVPEVMLGEGQTPAAEELLGDPYLPQEDAWRGEIISAPLSDRVERLDSGAGFVIPLELPPEQARLQVLLSGLPVGEAVDVTINDVPAGKLAVESPDLNDPSYRYDGAVGWKYAGWLKASLPVPPRLLHSGDNALRFSWKNPTAPTIAVKDLLFQLRYPTVPLAPKTLGPAPDLTNVEPATPPAGQNNSNP